jgi:ABC-2 type transport system ATP-binding protein
MSISVEHVSKRFGAQDALKDINFTIRSGEIVGFIGPNGAGKSTTMKIICGLMAPTSGEVLINELPAMQHSVQLRRYIGYLPENNPLYTDMYVKEYLLHVAGLFKLGKVSGNRVMEVIELTGLGPEMHKKIGVLSKGYRQRVGLAQAIIHNPDILIFDEPTSGLDPNQIVEIRNLISDLGKEKTVILSTHIMQEVEAICHRVIIINKGILVADDSTANIGNDSATTSSTIIVEFSEEPVADVFKDLSGISMVKKIRQGTWLIETTHGKDIRAELFNFAVKKNLVIVSLHRQDKKLEEVFRELTS